ncbi:MAG: triose-phosphate isomerase [Acidobacteriota bacterium]
MRRKRVIANWKMNLPASGIDHYLAALAAWQISDMVVLTVAPPFPFLSEIKAEADVLGVRCEVAAQNCSERPGGALTGEVSASMLRLTGASTVILGHSERRAMFGETSVRVAEKAVAASAGGLIPIVCVGEALEIRDSGDVSGFLCGQLQDSLSGFDPRQELIVAYEPVWAIGTGRNATPEVVAEAIAAMRECLNTIFSEGKAGRTSIVYGGSVTAENASELAAVAGVDGFLVGGASLDAAEFRVIYDAVRKAI